MNHTFRELATFESEFYSYKNLYMKIVGETVEGVKQISRNMEELNSGSQEMAQTSQLAAQKAADISEKLKEVNDTTKVTIAEVSQSTSQ